MDDLNITGLNLYTSYYMARDRLLECRAAIRKEQAALREQLAAQEETAKKLQAFLNIAKARTSNRAEPTGPLPYDNRRLSQLAVQIQAYNDPAAVQLYTETMAQKMGLEQREKRLRANAQTKLQAILNETRLLAAAPLEFLRKALINYSVRYQDSGMNLYFPTASLALGCWEKPFPHSAPELRPALDPVFPAGDPLLRAGDTILLPQEIQPHDGQLLIAEYTAATEAEVLGGIQRLLVNAALFHGASRIPLYDQVAVIDPIRFSAAGLGPVTGLCGKNRFIDPVPNSADAVRKKVGEIAAGLSRQTSTPKTGLYIFLGFPEAYDSLTASQIRQLAADAKYLGVTVLLASCKSQRPNDILENLKASALVLPAPGGPGQTGERFFWYAPPASLTDIPFPDYLVTEREIAAPQADNDYIQRVGLEAPRYRKGIRRLEDIPYGVDESGRVLSMSFEDSNFATFICGASRVGKSTLYHALISGILKNCHPDDVEIWLIDFKMTEFSRYMDPLPPQVRYIILDESPELVYDIVDRLTEILQKRQNRFMGKWEKLSDVPASTYMPAIMVIIDEFSVMSQIIADSAVNGRENYVVKMQLLLAKGAALGLHFIFASQGFTSGTRGLNDFSKKQVQQRLAMKTDYNEVKETLELKNVSDGDRAAMEHLTPHYVLTRIPEDEDGNHVQLAHVLYLSDTEAQLRMIRQIRENVHPERIFKPEDTSAYISKQPLIVNGQTYQTFRGKAEAIAACLSKQEEDGFTLFIGEPRRMLLLYPISITDEFSENLLLLASQDEKTPAASIIRSAVESLALQDRRAEMWTSGRNPVYRQLKSAVPCARSAAVGLDEVCQRIQALKQKIEAKQEGEGFFILLGFESLMLDMSFQSKAPSASPSGFRSRRAGGLDLLSQMAGGAPAGTGAGAAPEPGPAPVSEAYDAREDLIYILSNGPRLGYHFLMLFQTVGDINQSRLDTALFRHKILFRTAKADAGRVVGSAEAGAAAELTSTIFRYSNGLESLSFRPYLHPGLSWNGWQADGDKAVFVEEEQDYLQ